MTTERHWRWLEAFERAISTKETYSDVMDFYAANLETINREFYSPRTEHFQSHIYVAVNNRLDEIQAMEKEKK